MSPPLMAVNCPLCRWVMEGERWAAGHPSGEGERVWLLIGCCNRVYGGKSKISYLREVTDFVARARDGGEPSRVWCQSCGGNTSGDAQQRA